MPTRLILIRHGITQWNIQRRYCGHRDIPLSRQGREQARKLRRLLKGIEIDRFYSSNKKRALESARIIFCKRKITKVQALREINFGVLEGLHHEEIIKKYGKIYREWLKNPYSNRIPKAEKMDEFKKRVNSAIKKILRVNPGKTIAIVCHGGVIGIFLSSILKSCNFWRYVPAAGTITIVNHSRNGFQIKAGVGPLED